MYKVLTEVNGQWIDTWSASDEPMLFQTEADAQNEIDDYVSDCRADDIDIDPDDFKIVAA